MTCYLIYITNNQKRIERKIVSVILWTNVTGEGEYIAGRNKDLGEKIL